MKLKSVIMLICSFIIVVTLTGCWDEKPFENIGFILIAGYESSKDGKVRVTYSVPVTDINKKEQEELISYPVGLTREFREEARKLSPKSLQAGKIQQIIISEELAEKGIINMLEIFEREAENSSIVNVIISETSPHDLIEYLPKVGDKPRPAFYLSKLIRNNSDSGYIPDTTSYDFSVDYFAPGIDPITPLIKQETELGKGVKVLGSAIFSGDKMVGRIDTKETSLILAMKGKFKTTEYIFSTIGKPKEDATGKTGAAVTLKGLKRKINVKIENNKPVVNISLSFKGNYDEREWNHIDKKDIEESYEKIMSEELKDECMKTLKYTQEVGSDPIGIGDIVRAKYNSYWKKVNWSTAYKEAAFKVEVKLNITQHGIIN